MNSAPLPTTTSGLRQFSRDDGSISVFFAVFAIALLLAVGLVVDGGARIRAHQRVNAIAEEAARSGGQEVDIALAQSGEGVRLVRAQARAAATEHLRAAGIRGEVSILGDDRLVVRAEDSVEMIFLPLIGISSATVVGRGEARLLHRLSGD